METWWRMCRYTSHRGESPPVPTLSHYKTPSPRRKYQTLKKRVNSYLRPRQLVKEETKERENKQNSNQKAAKLNMHSHSSEIKHSRTKRMKERERERNKHNFHSFITILSNVKVLLWVCVYLNRSNTSVLRARSGQYSWKGHILSHTLM